MREHIEPDAGLGRLHRDAAHQLQMTSQVAQLLVLEAGDLDAEQVAQLQQHLVHGRVAGSLADAVDAGREHLRARAQRHHRVPGADAEVVVEVDDKGRVGRRGLDLRDVLTHRERRVAPDGVRGGRPGAAGTQPLAVELGDVVDVGAAAVLAAELDRGRPLRSRVADGLAHHPQVGGAIEPNRQLQPLRLWDALATKQHLAELVLDVQVRCRREDEVGDLIALVAQRVDYLHGRVDVALGRAHHADHLEVRPEVPALAAIEHQAQRFSLAFRDCGEPDVHDVDPDVGQHSSQLVLVLRSDRHARHLLAVPKRVVIDADLLRGRELQVV